MTTIREPELSLRALLNTTFSRTFTLKNRSSGAAIDLTGWAPTMLIFEAQGGAQVFELDPTNGLTIPTPANGTIQLVFFVDPTAGLPAFNLAAGTYWYRMRLKASPTNIWPLWPGELVVAPQ